MDKQTKEIDLPKVWQVIKADKKKIFVTTGLTTLLAIIYCIFATPLFTAKIIINPPKLTDAGTGLSALIGGIPNISLGGGFLSQKTDADVVIALLATNRVLDAQIKKFHLIDYYKSKDIELARRQLTGATKLVPDVKSGFITINVTDKNPKLATDIANYYAISLGQMISDVALGKSMSKSEFYEDQVEKAKLNLTDAENEVKDFAKKNGILAGSQAQVIAGLVTQLQAQLVTNQTRLNSMSLYATPDNPEYMQVKKEINSIKSQLANLNSGQGNADEISIPAGLAPDLAQQYINLMRDFIMREEIYKLVVKQYEANRLDSLSELDPTSIQIIDPAQVPLHKSQPKRLQILLIAFFLGVIASVSFILIKNRKQIII